MHRPRIGVAAALALCAVLSTVGCADPYIREPVGLDEQSVGSGAERAGSPSATGVPGVKDEVSEKDLRLSATERSAIDLVRPATTIIGDFHFHEEVDSTDAEAPGAPILNVYVTDEYDEYGALGPVIVINNTAVVTEDAVADADQTPVGEELTRLLGTRVVAEHDENDPRVFSAAVELSDGWIQFIGQDLDSEEQLLVFIEEFMNG